MDTLIKIVQADPSTPEIVAVIEAHNAHGAAHYPAESNHDLTPEDYAASSVRLWAAWQEGACVGMIGLQPLSDTRAEIKSMHVIDAARGKGVAAALMEHVLDAAAQTGFSSLWLETGSREGSAAARRLYERFGFSYCAPFEGYVEDPESVFMTRGL